MDTYIGTSAHLLCVPTSVGRLDAAERSTSVDMALSAEGYTSVGSIGDCTDGNSIAVGCFSCGCLFCCYCYSYGWSASPAAAFLLLILWLLCFSAAPATGPAAVLRLSFGCFAAALLLLQLLLDYRFAALVAWLLFRLQKQPFCGYSASAASAAYLAADLATAPDTSMSIRLRGCSAASLADVAVALTTTRGSDVDTSVWLVLDLFPSLVSVVSSAPCCQSVASQLSPTVSVLSRPSVSLLCFLNGTESPGAARLGPNHLRPGHLLLRLLRQPEQGALLALEMPQSWCHTEASIFF
ncbi:hypothetical protein PG991_001213 [Apiospora marii]|uniref:Uncharacterized protein n=1 Tax=Apiospora marii TaxID=335849 RepID=A0ABR1SUH3_9PEZI